MTLGEIRGGVIMRLGPREAVGKLIAGIDIEIHNAVDDIRSQARLAHVETLDRCAYLNTEANLDIYDWPLEADEIRDVFTLSIGRTPVPMTETGFRETAIMDWAGLSGTVTPFTWTALPGRRLRIMNRPSQSIENGIMIRFFPAPTRMVKKEDEPNLPRAVHENLIPRAIVRMASYDGIGLSHPAAFEFYKRDMQERLELFLHPASVSGAANHVRDMDAYYSGGG